MLNRITRIVSRAFTPKAERTEADKAATLAAITSTNRAQRRAAGFRGPLYGPATAPRLTRYMRRHFAKALKRHVPTHRDRRALTRSAAAYAERYRPLTRRERAAFVVRADRARAR